MFTGFAYVRLQKSAEAAAAGSELAVSGERELYAVCRQKKTPGASRAFGLSRPASQCPRLGLNAMVMSCMRMLWSSENVFMQASSV